MRKASSSESAPQPLVLEPLRSLWHGTVCQAATLSAWQSTVPQAANLSLHRSQLLKTQLYLKNHRFTICCELLSRVMPWQAWIQAKLAACLERRQAEAHS